MISQGGFEDAGNDLVRVRVDGSSGTLVICNADRQNVLSRRLMAQLHQGLRDLHQEKRVRAVILTSEGSTFSAGTDLVEIRDHLDDEQAQAQWFEDCVAQKEVIELMLRFPKPIIGAVNGPARGLGAVLVLACDLVVATPQANLGFPEVLRGLVSGLAVPLLAFRTGAAKAADLLFRAAPADAQDCERLGLFHWIVEPDLVWAKADAVARELAQTHDGAVAMTKRMLNETVGEHLFTQLSAGAAATASARTTEGAAEGIVAFLDKRDPEW